jgi:hypothetical protein
MKKETISKIACAVLAISSLAIIGVIVAGLLGASTGIFGVCVFVVWFVSFMVSFETTEPADDCVF